MSIEDPNKFLREITKFSRVVLKKLGKDIEYGLIGRIPFEEAIEKFNEAKNKSFDYENEFKRWWEEKKELIGKDEMPLSLHNLFTNINSNIIDIFKKIGKLERIIKEEKRNIASKQMYLSSENMLSNSRKTLRATRIMVGITIVLVILTTILIILTAIPIYNQHQSNKAILEMAKIEVDKNLDIIDGIKENGNRIRTTYGFIASRFEYHYLEKTKDIKKDKELKSRIMTLVIQLKANNRGLEEFTSKFSMKHPLL